MFDEAISNGVLQEKYLKGTFQGQEFVFHGKLSTGGLLITEQEVAHFGEAFAAIKPNGDVFRNGEKIGTFAEFQVTGESTVQPGSEATDEDKARIDSRARELAALAIIAALFRLGEESDEGSEGR